MKELTEDEKFEKAYAIQQEYEKKEIDTLKSVLSGKITSNEQMVGALSDLNRDYLSEVREFNPLATDLNPSTIQCYKDAEERGDGVVTTTYAVLRIFGIAEGEKKLVFVNDDGKPCDENGSLLSQDLEHRVFEVIPGGKQ